MTLARSLLLGAMAGVCGLAAACGGDDSSGGTCEGQSSAPADAVLVTIGEEAFTYGAFTAGENNDCPSGDPGAPVSVTIAGQEARSGFFFTLCLPRPDLLEGATALDDAALVQVVDLRARDANGCNVLKHPTAVPSGTVTFVGLCTSTGSSFTMTLAGQIAGLRLCEGAEEAAVELALSGEIKVVAE